MAKITPNPGSDAALEIGCICSVDSNNHGTAYQRKEKEFLINRDCPLHGSPINKDQALSEESKPSFDDDES